MLICGLLLNECWLQCEGQLYVYVLDQYSMFSMICQPIERNQSFSCKCCQYKIYIGNVYYIHFCSTFCILWMCLYTIQWESEYIIHCCTTFCTRCLYVCALCVCVGMCECVCVSVYTLFYTVCVHCVEYSVYSGMYWVLYCKYYSVNNKVTCLICLS